MTDNEIKKAFECCYLDKPCEECPLCEIKHADKLCFSGDVKKIPRMVLDLINRQEARIHQQEKTIMEIQNANLIDFKATIGNYIAENESLKAEVERLKAKANHYNYCYENFVNTPISRIKAEAYKEFADKLKLHAYHECDITGYRYLVVQIEKLDNLLNELVGDGDGKRKD